MPETTISFHLKHYARALHAHRQWAWLIVIAVGLYLVAAALTQVTYNVSQEFAAYSPDLPVAAAASPIATVKLNKVIAEPDLLFLDGTVMPQLRRKLGHQDDRGTPAEDAELRRLVRYALSLTETDGARLRLSYTGTDAAQGRLLIAFYTERLMKRIADGAGRTRPPLTPTQAQFQPQGAMVVVGERSLWNTARLLPAASVLALATLGVLILIGVFEWNDPSFKSERQIARYLGIPVLGALPDAEPLLRTLPK